MKKRILSTLLFLSLVLVPSFTSTSAENDAEEIIPIIYETAPIYDISPEFIEAVCFYESSYRNDVVSCTGNEGCMQLSPTLYEVGMREEGITSLTDAEGSIRIACDTFRDLFEKYGDCYEVLMFYNQGYSGIRDFENGNYSDYAIKVCKYAQELTTIHDSER